MMALSGALGSPFPYFGGKSLAAAKVWQAFGDVDNYVEPFAGSAAMLLGAPDVKRIETINDYDGFVSNFWRAISQDSMSVAQHADWPVNETDLLARHLWLVGQRSDLTAKLSADPSYYDAKIAGWWCWGACNWIGSGWCSGSGPWVLVDGVVTKGNAGQGVMRQLPHLSDSGQGVNRKLPHLGDSGRGDYIYDWFSKLQSRLRDVRVTCGDWARVVQDSVTTRHGVTGVFLDPPYEKGAMDYGNGGMRQGIAHDVRAWCIENTHDKKLRIVLCGHRGEHDELLDHGWQTRKWEARKGYALTEEAIDNSAGETIWCSPYCAPELHVNFDLFATEAI